MMGVMKRLFFLLSFSGAVLCGQDLSAVHSVYLLPMANGLDQHLANRLTNEHVFQVVTDPKLADAIFTDRIGVAFEEKLADLTANPEPVTPPPADDQPPPNASVGNSLNKLADPAANSSLGRSKGTVFLVNPKSHHVLWSSFQPLKGSDSEQVNRKASDIVSRLKRDLKSK